MLFTNVSVTPNLDFVRRSADTLLNNPIARKQVTPAPIDEKAPTLATVLGQAGYQSATVTPYVFYLRKAGITRGFTVVDDEHYRAGRIDGSGVVDVPLVDRVLTFLDGRNTNTPFFVWIHFMGPHAPYRARDGLAKGGTAEQRYDSELRFVDAEITRLVTELRQRRLLEKSLLIVHADHGEEFRDHGGEFHATTLYDEVASVPFLLRLPNAESGGRVITPPVSLVDLTPTIVDLLGIRTTATFAGRSLWPLIEHGEHSNRPVISECVRFGRRKRALIAEDHKIIVDYTVGTVEIFTHSSDPREQTNLAGQEDLRTMMLSLLKGVEQTILHHRATPLKKTLR